MEMKMGKRIKEFEVKKDVQMKTKVKVKTWESALQEIEERKDGLNVHFERSSVYLKIRVFLIKNQSVR